jgi:signal transduction histidine kinase
MTLNATRVECGTLGSDACAYRMVAERLPGVAVLVFDRELRFELVTSMRERAQALGGQLAIETGRGGTSIQAWVPAGPGPAPRRPR